MEIIQKIQQEDLVKPLAKENQITLKGGRKQTTFTYSIQSSQSSPPRWKDE